MHSSSLKTSQGAQNMKNGLDALGTAENESGSAKHGNGTRRPRYGRKRVWGAKHENGIRRLGTTENESERVK
jgi:hypothetical protein